MSEDNKKLIMTFDPKVIEHLGIRMYSTIPPVLGQLIANAYDADATEVKVELEDSGCKKIIVKDNGIVMSFTDINEKFLVIGRNRRTDGEDLTPKGRKVVGNKGIGKLSFVGIVKTITVNTVMQGKSNIFKMDWDDLMNSTQGRYLITPEVIDETVGSDAGTEIVLTNITRTSDFSEEFLAYSIARFFIFAEEFSVTMRRNNGEVIGHYQMICTFPAFAEEFSWDFPADFAHRGSDYEYRSNMSGKILTPEKPIAPRYDSRGISLFSRGKLVQSPYQFSDSTSSHFFSYMTGWLKVDFIEDFPEDVIATNRRNINWGYSQTNELHKYIEKCIRFVQSDWRKKRIDKKAEEVNQNLGDTSMEAWIESMPEKIRPSFKALTTKIIENFPEVGPDESNQLSSEINKIIPPYPHYHWRELHTLH